MPAPPIAVDHNVTARRFEIRSEGAMAFLHYAASDGRIRLIHTEVAPSLRRRGYGSQLVHAALEYARTAQLRVVPVCPFVRAYLDHHPEYRPLIDASPPAS